MNNKKAEIIKALQITDEDVKELLCPSAKSVQPRDMIVKMYAKRKMAGFATRYYMRSAVPPSFRLSVDGSMYDKTDLKDELNCRFGYLYNGETAKEVSVLEAWRDNEKEVKDIYKSLETDIAKGFFIGQSPIIWLRFSDGCLLFTASGHKDYEKDDASKTLFFFNEASWLLKQKNDQVDEDVNKALEIINQKIKWNQEQDTIAKLISKMPLGWTVPVEIDETKGLEERKKGLTGDDKVNELIDVFGCYENEKNESVNNSEYPTDYKSKIILYTKAIREYRDLLNPDIDIQHMYAYVLAHELFHARQDFEVGLMHSFDRLNKNNDNTLIVQTETLAEFFALRFVKKELKDDLLFEELCRSRSKELLDDSPCKRYAEALNKYGDIKSDKALDGFRKALDDWTDKMIEECYS